nr:MAG TPA: hypothetical protein [Bacteriophage sp.]
MTCGVYMIQICNRFFGQSYYRLCYTYSIG